MTYRIELAATAKADIHGQAEWLRENVSPTAATKWLDGLYKAIERKERCFQEGTQTDSCFAT